MTGLLSKIVVRFLRARWGSILPAIFKAAAEGQFGPTVKRAYWAAAAYKTVTGAVIWAVGAGMDTVCGGYPSLAWTCQVAPWVYYAGMILTGVGLADGGTRAPYPAGTPIRDEDKTR